MQGLRYVDQRGDDVLRAAASVASAKIGAVLSPQAQPPFSVARAKLSSAKMASQRSPTVFVRAL
jgi:hypothetical protein